jgi:hypothetical protein
MVQKLPRSKLEGSLPRSQDLLAVSCHDSINDTVSIKVANEFYDKTSRKRTLKFSRNYLFCIVIPRSIFPFVSSLS